jgi:hypothetical protein
MSRSPFLYNIYKKRHVKISNNVRGQSPNASHDQVPLLIQIIQIVFGYAVFGLATRSLYLDSKLWLICIQYLELM